MRNLQDQLLARQKDCSRSRPYCQSVHCRTIVAVKCNLFLLWTGTSVCETVTIVSPFLFFQPAYETSFFFHVNVDLFSSTMRPRYGNLCVVRTLASLSQGTNPNPFKFQITAWQWGEMKWEISKTTCVFYLVCVSDCRLWRPKIFCFAVQGSQSVLFLLKFA